MNDINDIILIYYRGRGFSGNICIHSMEYFPIPVTHMKRLMKICQMGEFPENVYLDQFMEVLNYLQKHSAFFSHRKVKILLDDIKVIQERLDRIGGRRP